MKNIRTHEEFRKQHIPKFDEGDAVKIINDNTNTIYVISGYDYTRNSNIKNECRLQKYADKDKYANSEDFFKWVLEEELIPVEDHEIDALKYNL